VMTVCTAFVDLHLALVAGAPRNNVSSHADCSSHSYRLYIEERRNLQIKRIVHLELHRSIYVELSACPWHLWIRRLWSGHCFDWRCTLGTSADRGHLEQHRIPPRLAWLGCDTNKFQLQQPGNLSEQHGGKSKCHSQPQLWIHSRRILS
jgi:hypothetical protein